MVRPDEGVTRSRVADQIIEALRERILTGEYPRGSKLPTEKVLALEFGVSAPTVREALRALTSLGLVDVRHGSGAYVRTNSEGILRGPLGMLMQLESVGVEEMVGLIHVLTLYALDRAVTAATDDDIRRLRQAADQSANCSTVEEASDSGYKFLVGLSAASHQPLLEALCSFLATVLMRLETMASLRHDSDLWRKWMNETAKLRFRIVDAFGARDLDALKDGFNMLHASVSQHVASVPTLRTARLSDPELQSFVREYIFDSRS